MTGQINVNKIAARTGNTITVESGDVLQAPGHVVQVVQVTGTTQVNNTSSGWTSVHSSLQLTITPKSTSNKILVTYSIWGYIVGPNKHLAWDLARSIGGGSTSRLTSHAYGMGSIYPVGSEQQGMCHIEYLDSPNTTSAVLYIPQFNNVDASGNNCAFGVSNRLSTVTATEIAQ